MMKRRDWLLLLLALKDADQPLDQFRFQAAMYLLGQVDGAPRKGWYSMTPANWSAFENEVDVDLASLEESGFASRDASLGPAWAEFVATEKGLEEARRLVAALKPAQRKLVVELEQIKRGHLSKAFRDLADFLSTEHPEFASGKVFR